MFIRLTPGLSYIFDSLPRPLITIILVHVIRKYSPWGVQMSPLTWSLLYILAYPAITLCRYVVGQLLQEIEIRRLHARRAPTVYSRLPFGISILQKLVQTFSHRQLGEDIEGWQTECGYVWSFSIFSSYSIFTMEPDHIRSMLATNFDNFVKGPILHAMLKSVLGNGVFNADGDIWKFHRAMTRPFFVKDRVTDFDIFERHADCAIDKMIERFAEGEALDFQDIMSRLTLDTAAEFLFGSSVHSLMAPLPYAHNSLRNISPTSPHPSSRFARAFGQAQVILALRYRLRNMWPLAEIFKDKTKEPMAIINEYIDPIIMEALNKKKRNTDSQKQDPSVPETLLDHLVQTTDDIAIVRDEVINIMIAGRDTTMCTLTFVMYCLSENPHVLATLRQEILTKIGPTRRPTYEDFKECKYLRAVINETLRLYPPVPVNVRLSVDSTTWEAKDGGRPYYIPANCPIVYAVFLMHRRTDLWGPDGILSAFVIALETQVLPLAINYDPNRFLDERVHKYLTPNPFIFLPFNAGPRICLGQQFAYNEISFVITRLLQAFETITLDLDAQPPDSRPPAWKGSPEMERNEKIWLKAHLTLYAYKGLWLRMKRA